MSKCSASTPKESRQVRRAKERKKRKDEDQSVRYYERKYGIGRRP